MAEENQSAAQPGLAQCEITGQWLPEDELITIQGHRVCAEGKQVLLERLKSGEVLPGELERPSVLRRFSAMFVDGLIVGVVNGILVFLFVGTMFISQPAFGSTTASSMITRAALAGIIGNLLFFTYLSLMHGMGGQTVGKMAAKIRVVKEDGSPIDLQIATLRTVYYMGYNIIPQLMTLIGLVVVGQVVGLLGGVYVIASIIVALVDTAQQRAIHDRLAGTRVVVVA